MFINTLSLDKLPTITSSSLVARTLQRQRPSPFYPSHRFLYYHQYGTRAMDIDGTRREFLPGDVFLFFPGQRYLDHGSSEAYKAINIVFTAHDEDCFSIGSELPPPEPTCVSLPNGMNTKGHADIEIRFRDIALAHNSDSAFKQHHATIMLMELLMRLADLAQHHTPGQRGTIAYAKHYLQHHAMENPSLDDLAAMVGMSRTSLTKRFREQTGMSVNRYIQQLKINHACNLIQGDETIRNKEIAAQLGFYDEYHFSKTFKNVVGKTPREYRRQLAV